MRCAASTRIVAARNSCCACTARSTSCATTAVKKGSFTLDRNNLALCVPPTIWNTMIFQDDNSVVMVLCDRLFEEADYLREYSEFLAFRKANS